MDIIIQPLLWALGIALILIVVMALLSPFETVEWWELKKRPDRSSLDVSVPLTEAAIVADADQYVIYLTAIGGVSAAEISNREQRFLNKLEVRLPTAVFIDDVFPFSVTNNPLTGERALSSLWKRIHNSRRARTWYGTLFSSFIFVRNLLQVGVSGDSRYGPIYNAGVAKELVHSLLRHGYPPNSGMPIAVMGWSGGGQIAVGVARYLNQGLHAPVRVISIGGVMADDPAIAYVERLYHLQGSRDNYPKIGELLYPGRWGFLSATLWNQAKANGRIQFVPTGPMRHTGREDYFDHKATLPDGTTYLDRTVEIVAEILS